MALVTDNIGSSFTMSSAIVATTIGIVITSAFTVSSAISDDFNELLVSNIIFSSAVFEQSIDFPTSTFQLSSSIVEVVTATDVLPASTMELSSKVIHSFDDTVTSNVVFANATFESIAEVVDGGSLILSSTTVDTKLVTDFVASNFTLSSTAFNYIIENVVSTMEFQSLVDDASTLTNTVTSNFTLSSSIVEAYTPNDFISSEFTLASQTFDILSASDMVASTMTFTSKVIDVFGSVAYSVSGLTNALSIYTDWGVRSIAQLDTLLFAETDAGLCIVDSDTDQGTNIAASMQTGRLLFDTTQRKTPYSVNVVGIISALDITVKASNVLTGQEESYTYPVELASAGTQTRRNARAKLGRGLNSINWEFTFSNVQGSFFAIDSAQFVIEEFDRHL